MKKIIAIIMLILVAFMIAGCKKETPPTTPVIPEPEPVTQPPLEEQTVEELADSGENLMVITSGKVLEPREITINEGETIIIKNDNGAPHIIRVADGVQELTRSKRLMPGDVFEYAFTQKGVFTIRDVFSGSVNGEVIVE